MGAGKGRRLFVLLGLTPGVLHTVLCAWGEMLNLYDEIVILATDENVVNRAIELASTCPCPARDGGEPPLSSSRRLSKILLKHADYDSIEAVNELRRVLDEQRIGEGDAVDVTGGRKLASLVAGLYAASRGALVGYSLVPSDEYRRLVQRSGLGCGEETVRKPPRLIAPLP